MSFNFKRAAIISFSAILLAACSDNDGGEAEQKPVNPSSIPNITYIDIQLKENSQQKYSYKAIRIGEYYWMKNNMNNPVESSGVSQEQVNRQLSLYQLSQQDYAVSISDFNAYYGQYYSLPYISNVLQYAVVSESNSEDKSKVINTAWQLPSKSDFRQLFGMCGDASYMDIRYVLMGKQGKCPVLPQKELTFDYNFWYDLASTSDMYGFTMLMAGGRFLGESDGTNNKGDLTSLFKLAFWATNDDGYVALESNSGLNTNGGRNWWGKNVRFCRKLSAEELGYRLYINTSEKDISKIDAKLADIIKLPLDSSAPTGYYELENGFLRGFYVQNRIEGINNEIKIEDMVNQAKNLGYL